MEKYNTHLLTHNIQNLTYKSMFPNYNLAFVTIMSIVNRSNYNIKRK